MGVNGLAWDLSTSLSTFGFVFWKGMRHISFFLSTIWGWVEKEVIPCENFGDMEQKERGADILKRVFSGKDDPVEALIKFSGRWEFIFQFYHRKNIGCRKNSGKVNSFPC